MLQVFPMEDTTDTLVDIRSRISVFEALSTQPSTRPSSKSPQNLLDTPNSPTPPSLSPIIPSIKPQLPLRPSSRSPSPSPPILGRKTSLIDLKDWIVDDDVPPIPPRPKPLPNGDHSTSVNGQRHCATSSDPLVRPVTPQSTPLIHLEQSSPKQSSPKAPPLPPRKPSYGSLRSVSASNSSSSSLGGARSPNASSVPLPGTQSRKKSDSLTVDHTYPPFAKLGIAIPRTRVDGSGHVAASSISSFHSVSLSSDGGTDPTTPGSLSNHVATFPIDRDLTSFGDSDDFESSLTREPDTISLDESFENVSCSSAISPSVSTLSQDWGEIVRRRPEPPKLPQRPSTKPSPTITTSPSVTGSSPHVSPQLQSKRSPPPPPPSRARVPPPPPAPSNRSSLVSTVASDRSSILSTATSRTSLSSVHKPSYPPPSRASSSSSSTNSNAMSPLPPPHHHSHSSHHLQAQSPNSLKTLQQLQQQQQQFSALSVKEKARQKQKQAARPTPVPPAARKRYEAVFDGNVLAVRKVQRQQPHMNLVASNGDGGLGGLLGSLRADMRSPPPGSGRRRQAAGWRGLSVDLITNPEMMQHCGGKEDGVDGLNGGVEKMKEVGKVVDKVKDQGKGEIVGPEERLDGRVVKRIWRTSKLGDAKLKEIWTECDPSGTGSIDRNTFVKAMWKIDEELRRAQLHRNTPPTFSDLQKRRSTRMVQ